MFCLSLKVNEIKSSLPTPKAMHRPNKQHVQRGSPLPRLPEKGQRRAWILIQLPWSWPSIKIISYSETATTSFLSFTISNPWPQPDPKRFAAVSLAPNKDDILRPQGYDSRPSLDLLLSNHTFGCGNVPCEFLKVKITVPTEYFSAHTQRENQPRYLGCHSN